MRGERDSKDGKGDQEGRWGENGVKEIKLQRAKRGHRKIKMRKIYMQAREDARQSGKKVLPLPPPALYPAVVMSSCYIQLFSDLRSKALPPPLQLSLGKHLLWSALQAAPGKVLRSCNAACSIALTDSFPGSHVPETHMAKHKPPWETCPCPFP